MYFFALFHMFTVKSVAEQQSRCQPERTERNRFPPRFRHLVFKTFVRVRAARNHNIRRARRYRYILQNTLNRNGILAGGVSVYRGDYDVTRMHRAAQVLLGEHDFSSFKGADDESRSSNRCVHFIEVSRHGPFIVFDIAANAFLNHMVRNIVGSLLLIGEGRKDSAWLKEVLEAADRSQAGPMARPDGLYLVDVTYPSDYRLPRREALGPLWLL